MAVSFWLRGRRREWGRKRQPVAGGSQRRARLHRASSNDVASVAVQILSLPRPCGKTISSRRGGARGKLKGAYSSFCSLRRQLMLEVSHGSFYVRFKILRRADAGGACGGTGEITWWVYFYPSSSSPSARRGVSIFRFSVSQTKELSGHLCVEGRVLAWLWRVGNALGMVVTGSRRVLKRF